MRALVIACGNTLRRDDGVAARALELIGDSPGIDTREVQQLTPELASDISASDIVVFVDADPRATSVRVERIPPMDHRVSLSALTHAPSADEVVALARVLFDWRGAAFTCALPVCDLSAGEALSARAEVSARIAARALRRLLRQRASAGN